MRVILAAVHITALQFTGTRSVVAGRQLKSKQLVGTEMPSFLFIRTGPKEPRGSSNFLFFSLFLISLLFFARKASFTRILSLDLKVSLIVPFDLKVSLSLDLKVSFTELTVGYSLSFVTSLSYRSVETTSLSR